MEGKIRKKKRHNSSLFAFRQKTKRYLQVVPQIMEDLKAKARSLGLWNLFLGQEYPEGAGLTNLEYSLIAEITGRSPKLAPEAMNCSAPDTGNMGEFC